MTSRRTWIAVAVALLSAVAGATARAQSDWSEVASPHAAAPEVAAPAWPAPASREPDLPTFPVLIHGDEPGVSIRLVTSDRGEIPCGARCTVELPVGRYRLVAAAPNGRLSTKYLDVGGPIDVGVTPQNYAARNTGFVLMGSGLVVGGGGIVMGCYWFLWRVVVGLSCSEGPACTDEDYPPKWMLPTSLVAVGVGLASGLTGLTLWRNNRHAGVTVRPLGSGLALGGTF